MPERTDTDRMNFLQNNAGWCLDKCNKDVELDMVDGYPPIQREDIREAIDEAIDAAMEREKRNDRLHGR